MRNVKSAARNKKWLVIPIVGILLMLSLILAVGFMPIPESSALRKGMTTTAPAGFVPQLVQNKYSGGTSVLDGEDNILVSCARYDEENIKIPAGQWYLNETNNTYCMALDEDSAFSKAALDFSKPYPLHISFHNEIGELIVLETAVTEAFSDHVLSACIHNTAKAAELNRSDPEKNIVFLDAQINEYADNGQKTTYYNVADEGWTSYTDAQINELKSYCDNREKKLKLKVELQDTLTGYWNRTFENITSYIPKWVFLEEGKSAFIGNEYGFIMDIEKIFNPYTQADNYYINSFLLFSLDRQMVGREYSFNVEVMINSEGSAYIKDHYKEEYTPDDYVVEIEDDEYSNSHLLLADPSMSVNLHNLYDLNEFDENYVPEQDNEISVSQVRLNYDGFNGKKEKKKLVSASEIKTSIYSMTKDAYEIADKIVDLAIGKDIMELIAEKAPNIFGKAAGIVLKVNPYVAIVSAAIDIGKEITKLIDSNKTVFASAKANNEANILTFPAPSEEATKSAVSRFGLLSSNSSEEAAEALAFEDGDQAEFVLSKYGHYAQSIFVLNEITKPTALTSYMNMAFALDNSGTFNSNVQKFHIPERFNYSERTTKLFDDGRTETVCSGEEKQISFFGSSQSKIQLSVPETGYYDLSLSNFSKTAKIRFDTPDNNNGNPYEQNSNLQVPYKFTENHMDDIVSLKPVNGSIGKVTYVDTDNDGFKDTARLFLNAETDSKFILDIGKNFSYDDGDRFNGVFNGAAFQAKLTRHYDEIDLGTTSVRLEGNQKQYFTFVPKDTDIYKFEDGNGKASFDLYTDEFVTIQTNQSKLEAILAKGQKYYLGISNKLDGNTDANISVQKAGQIINFDYTSQLQLNGTLLSDERIKAYCIDIERAGTYTLLNKNENVLLQIKDAQLNECLFGASKANLKKGKYYLIVRNAEESIERESYEISMQFKPREIVIEKDYIIVQDSYYSFTAKESGDYKFNLTNDNCNVALDGLNSNGNNIFSLIKGQNYIVHIIKPKDAEENLSFNIQYYPNVYKTYNETFNDKIIQFETDISGYYYFNGDGLSLFDDTLNRLKQGSDFSHKLYEGKKYFIINSGTNACEIVLDVETVTVNFEFTVNAGVNQFLKFVAPENGYYDLKSYYNNGNTVFAVYKYDELSKGISLTRGEDGYALTGGLTYYIQIDANNTDFVTIKNGNITMLTEIPEGTLAEVELDDEFNYAASYKFVPIESGKYKFIFNRNLKKDFTILIDGRSYTFAQGQNILEIPLSLQKGMSYEINFSLLSFGNATLVFGVYKQPETFDTYVSDRLQTNDGTVNKIAIGENKDGYVYEQIAVGNIDGRAAYNNITFSILNIPYVNGQAGVRIDTSGRLTVSNALPQWTAFAVEVNIGKYVYGDVVLDEGISKVINFLIYVDVQDIKILDENANPIYNIDIAHKESMELTAKVFPNHAAQADQLQYYMSETDQRFVSLEVSGNKATITGLYTTPNKKYVKIQASCGDEFTVIIMVRVYAQQIYASSSEDIKQLENAAGSAYEIIINGSNLGELNVSPNVQYLKIRAGSKNVLNNFSINVQSNNLTLALESLNIYGMQKGLINAKGYNLNLHFINLVELYGWDGSYPTITGSSAISASDLTITKEGTNTVKIIGGDGFSQYSSTSPSVGGNGGSAIAVTGNVVMNNTQYITVQGGNGGSGSAGKNGTSVRIEPTARDQEAETGNDGITGGAGGNGGSAIVCTSYQANNCEYINLNGGNGGNGGKGGDGSQGGNGGKGHDSDGKDASNGKVGGKGGNGARGGNGGSGAIAISGKIVVKDSKITLKSGNGGNAGAGGHGANGGRGGDGGDDKAVFGKEGIGGVGGNGGNGGQPGNAGSKGAVVSDSKITKYGSSSVTKSASSDGSSALVGYKGYGGEGGTQGNPGGYDADVLAKADYGADGTGRTRY